MGIVNAGQLMVYSELEDELREHVEDVLFDRRNDATERLVELAADLKDHTKIRKIDSSGVDYRQTNA